MPQGYIIATSSGNKMPAVTVRDGGNTTHAPFPRYSDVTANQPASPRSALTANLHSHSTSWWNHSRGDCSDKLGQKKADR